MKRSTIRSLQQILFLFFAAMPCFAASAADGAGPAVAAAREPQAVPLIDIPWRADRDERFADEIITRSSGEDPVAGIASAFQEIERSVDEKTRLFRSEELRALPVLRLEGLARYWQFDALLHARWKEELRAAIDPNVRDVAELSARRLDWAATREALPESALPAALSQRIDVVIARLKEAESSLSVPLERQLALSRRANLLETKIQLGERATSDAIRYIDRRLGHTDRPPLWATQPALGGQEAGTVDTLKKGLGLEYDFLSQYSSAGLGSQRVLQVLQALALPLLIWLAWRARRDPGARDGATMRIVSRPLSAWLLLSMIGILTVEHRGPLMMHQVAMVVALVPVLRLLPETSRQTLGPWPLVITAFYLLQRASFLLLSNSLLFRWYYFFLALLGLVFTLWLLWSARGDGARLRGWLGAGAWASVVLFGVSLACNLLGNASMAEMLTTGVIDSAYMALVVYAAVAVARAFLRELLAVGAVRRLRVVEVQGEVLVRGAVRGMIFLAALGWLAFTMDRLRIFRPVYDVLHSALTHPFSWGQLSISLGLVLLFVFSVFLAVWVARAVRFILKEEVLPKVSLPRGVGNSIASLSYYALLLIGIYVALSAAGFQMGQLAFLFGAIGVGIGLGLQGVVNNFVSGLILMFERPIQPGDVVEISGVSGTVREIGMRSTRVRTGDGADVVVPNGALLSEKLTNWTLADRNRRLDIIVNVGYGSDPARVLEILARIAKETPKVAAYPAPAVSFENLGASSLDFAVRVWSHDLDNLGGIRTEMLARIYRELQEAGIEIPYPQQDLHLRTVSPEAARALGGLKTGAQESGA